MAYNHPAAAEATALCLRAMQVCIASNISGCVVIEACKLSDTARAAHPAGPSAAEPPRKRFKQQELPPLMQNETKRRP